MNYKQRIVYAVAALLVAGANLTQAANYTWTGGQSNQWSMNKNWSPQALPGASDTAVFAGPVSGSQPTVNKDQSVLGIAFTGTGGWTVGSGNTLTVGTGGIDQTGSGTNTVAAAVALNGHSTWTVNSGTLIISGVISGGANSLKKDGAGTLRLSASNSYTGGTTVDAGTLQFATAGNRLSTSGSITVNGGTLDLGGFGQTTSGNVTLAGGVVTNGTLTKTAGSFAARSGTASATLAGSAGFQKTTGGIFKLIGNHSYTGATVVSEGSLIVNGSIASSSGVQVASGATLGGYGNVSAISGAGTVSPGESPGILTTTSVDASGGLDFRFEFANAAIAGISQPDFLNPADSGNDLLRITGATPFTFALTADNLITVDFSGVTLTHGDRFLGGFYTADDAFESISGAQFDYIGLAGHHIVNVSMVQWTADFGSGPVNGYITQFEVIPEPQTLALFALSAGGMAVLLRRRRI